LAAALPLDVANLSFGAITQPADHCSEVAMSLISARQVIRNPANYSASVVREAAAQLFDSTYATLDDIRDASQAIAAQAT
jgi:hypothetical protein